MSSGPGGRDPTARGRSGPFLQKAVLGRHPQSPAEASGALGPLPKGSGSEGTERGHVRRRAWTGQEAEAQLAKALVATETLD